MVAATSGGCCIGPNFDRVVPLVKGERLVQTFTPCFNGTCTLLLDDGARAVTAPARAASLSWNVSAAGATLSAGETGLQAARELDRTITLHSFNARRGVEYEVVVEVTRAPAGAVDLVPPRLRLVSDDHGYSPFRATVGVGLGLGAQAQLSGLLHGGLMVGLFGEIGPHYDAGFASFGGYSTIGPWHYQGFGAFVIHANKRNHECVGLLPGLGLVNPRPSAERRPHPWAFELGVALLFIDVHLGFDPVAVWHH